MASARRCASGYGRCRAARLPTQRRRPGMRGRSYTIGVVLGELSSPFQPEVAQGVSDELEKTPYQDVIVTTGISADRQKRSVEALLDRQVDGLVLVAPWLEVTGSRRSRRRCP